MGRASQQADGNLPGRSSRGDDTAAFRPSRRPPMALLQVMDDSQRSGQLVRLRSDQCVLGRNACDLNFPTDRQISERHARVQRRPVGVEFRWYLRDLDSRNGTFVRIERVRLKGRREFIIGRRRFVFLESDGREMIELDSNALQASDFAPSGMGPPDVHSTAARDRGEASGGTKDWLEVERQGPNPEERRARLIELAADGSRRIAMLSHDQTLGSDPRQCSLAVSGDGSISPVHARLRRGADGAWHLEDAGSLNGLWLRVESVHLSRETMFWIGEQRVIFRPL